MGPLRPFGPALAVLLVGLFAFWCGTLPGGAAWPGAAVAAAAVLVLALGGLAEAADPLRLGRAGRLLTLAFAIAVAGSVLASPVPRAGRTALALLPAFLLLPAAFARAFEGERRRRLALGAWSAVVAAVALAGIVGVLRFPGTNAALPLGHHNLLGAFLVVMLPVAALSLRARGPQRVLAALATLSALTALALTRSLGAALAAAVVALVAPRLLGPAFGRARHLVAGLALLALGLAVPRVAALLRGTDPSGAARRVYAEAAVAGWAERPIVGWGAGSVPWRLAEFLRPAPGVNPPGELVGQAHSLPLSLAFELGATGLLLTAALLFCFARARWRERATAVDPELAAAGLLGLLGGVVAALSDSWLAIPALPVALAATLGAALAGGASASVARPASSNRAQAALAALLLGVGAAVLVRPALAHRHWELAARAPDRAVAGRELAEAVRLDPGFPLYRARWSWVADAPAAERSRAALAAAEQAGGVAPLWLRAGSIAAEAGEARAARRALARALALDPLSGSAPFLSFTLSSALDADCAGRAILAEPRLAAAALWRAFPAERDRALERIRLWPGIDTGWKVELFRRAERGVPSRDGDEVDLAVEVDRTASLAASLHLFRRSSFPGEVSRIRLDRAAARALKLTGASALALSSAAAFPLDRCAPVDLFAPEPAEPRGEPLFRDGFETGDPRRWTPPPR